MEILNDLDFTEIGQIRKSHGYKGHLKIFAEEHWLEDLAQQAFIFLEIDGYKVPFEIEEVELEKDLMLKLARIDSPEELTPYRQKKIYLLTRDIKIAKSIVENQQEVSKLIGMHIHDATLGDLGPIIRIDEYPQQEMAIIKSSEGREILIPLHEQLITSVSAEEEKIYMDLPEGLI